jgi:hypothetical protein
MTGLRFVSLLLLAILAMGASAFAERGSGRCYAVRVHPAEAEGRNGNNGRSGRSISATAAKDLVIEVSVPDAAASSPVQVKLFTPRGRLYQVIEAHAGESEMLDGGGRGRRGRGRTLEALFPMAGTPVVTNALFGEWRAEVYLDGAETPCLRPLEFVIER